MQVLRTTKAVIETEEFKVGDQIKINLKNYGEISLTAQKVTQDGTLFMFDRILTERCMNDDWTNKGGYEASDLNKWLRTELYESFPDDIKKRITNIAIPTYGQIFGHGGEFYKNFEPDNDEQFELMKERTNRIFFDSDGYACWYWLQNATKENVSSAGFAFVGYNGVADVLGASDSFGVLPVILLR